MYNIPIIDSLTHPTIDTNWILPKYPRMSCIDKLLSDMDQYNISHALSVGMKGIGNYDEKKYIDLIKPYTNRLVPIAFFDLHDDLTLSVISNMLRAIKKLGYKGIKLHPRISNFKLQNPLLAPVIKQANEMQLSVLLCTYFYNRSDNSFNNVDELANLIFELDGAKVILLHAGSVRLLETIEIARAHNNVLLDLSFTLCKYMGSSIDLDIQYAFNSFDERICIGSDFPQYSLSALRERYNFFAKKIQKYKAENIAFRNIVKFLQLPVNV